MTTIKAEKESQEKRKGLTMLIAYAVRSSVEDMHAEGIIPQNRMQEFNTNVRDSIYSTLLILEKAANGDEKYLDILDFMKMSIPTYWEEPKEV
jgi:hypothetical protein